MRMICVNLSKRVLVVGGCLLVGFLFTHCQKKYSMESEGVSSLRSTQKGATLLNTMHLSEADLKIFREKNAANAGKSFEEKVAKALKAAEAMLKTLSKDASLPPQKAVFEIVDGTPVPRFEPITAEQLAKYKQRGQLRKQNRSFTDCSHDDPDEARKCAVGSFKACQARGGKPILVDCIDCGVLCDE